MGLYRSGEFGGQVPESSVVASIGAALVATETGLAPSQEAPSHKKVGERFADVATALIGGEDNERFLSEAIDKELFRSGVLILRDGRRFGVAMVRNNRAGDSFGIEPLGESSSDMARTVYSELTLIDGTPDRVLRVTIDPDTGKNAPQERDTLVVGPGEMTELERIVAATQWGEVEQRQTNEDPRLNDMFNVQKPFGLNRPELPPA
jgi:hypothetical protein